MTTLTNILQTLWPLIVGGLGITAATQIIKRVAQLEKSSVIKFLFHAVTISWTLLSYVLGAHGISALLVALHGGALGYFGNLLYPAVKWLDTKLGKLRQAFAYVNKELPAVENDIKDVNNFIGTVTTTVNTQNTNDNPAPVDF